MSQSDFCLEGKFCRSWSIFPPKSLPSGPLLIHHLFRAASCLTCELQLCFKQTPKDSSSHYRNTGQITKIRVWLWMKSGAGRCFHWDPSSLCFYYQFPPHHKVSMNWFPVCRWASVTLLGRSKTRETHHSRHLIVLLKVQILLGSPLPLLLLLLLVGLCLLLLERQQLII